MSVVFASKRPGILTAVLARSHFENKIKRVSRGEATVASPRDSRFRIQ